jgi:MSHA biogenesis protein MshG
MPVFAYRGRGVRGELIAGTLEAADAGAVADQLVSTGVTPVDIHAAKLHVEARAPEWLKKAMAPGVSLVDLMLFSRQMYTLLKAGVPILRALGGLEESATCARASTPAASCRRRCVATRRCSRTST